MNEGRFWKVAEKKNLVTYLGEITKKLKCMLNVVFTCDTNGPKCDCKLCIINACFAYVGVHMQEHVHKCINHIKLKGD
jgi:hypothetical protein